MHVYRQDGSPEEWEQRLAGYHLLLTADTLVPGLRADTFDTYLIEVSCMSCT